MKQFTKYFMIVAMVFATLLSTTVAYAASDARRGSRGASGTVTAVDASSMTIERRNGTEATVNVSDETTVNLVATQSDGAVGDIQVGDSVKVRGSRNDDGSVDARSITVQPSGDKVSGRVGAVDGSTITLNRRGGTMTVNTNGDTAIFVDGEAATLADITEGMKVTAYGAEQGEDALDATLVLAKAGRR